MLHTKNFSNKKNLKLPLLQFEIYFTFTFNSDYLINHTKIKGKLRNYDPLKQSFLFLPNDNPKRPIIVPQEYLILNDDSLLREYIPICISNPLPPIQPIASQPLGDCEKLSRCSKKGIFI